MDELLNTSDKLAETDSRSEARSSLACEAFEGKFTKANRQERERREAEEKEKEERAKWMNKRADDLAGTLKSDGLSGTKSTATLLSTFYFLDGNTTDLSDFAAKTSEKLPPGSSLKLEYNKEESRTQTEDSRKNSRGSVRVYDVELKIKDGDTTKIENASVVWNYAELKIVPRK